MERGRRQRRVKPLQWRFGYGMKRNSPSLGFFPAIIRVWEKGNRRDEREGERCNFRRETNKWFLQK